MTSRPTHSREPSLLTVDSMSRRSSLASNPDIFSDDYALEPIDPNLDLSLVDSIQSEHTFTNQHTNIVPYPALPPRLSQLHRPTSVAKRSLANDGASSSRDGAVRRTLSTSSRITIPRSQSPYVGPTAPSHPYAMYPQVTRASSIASMSTIRNQERPFVSTGGPEHPYSMYPQNTVTEDEDIGTQPIPLGFPGAGFASSSSGANSDVGDIVGFDGHVEQLPAYTRWDDNVVAKGDMRDINGAPVVEIDNAASESASLMPARIRRATARSSEQMQLMEPEDVSEEEAAKEGWKEKAQRKVCGGIALWLLVLVVALVALAAVLGGVIGGVVGRRQATTEAVASSTATTTIYMDADPASTDSSTPTCPTGKYSIPFNQTQEIRSCVGNNAYINSWSCLDIAYLGMTIGRAANGSTTVQFDDYSVDTAQFLYGPQPPDFNGSTINLSPFKDRDNANLGVAMYFYEEFDKLIILPSYAITPTSKREINERDILERTSTWDNTALGLGDAPWYCFWNATINEFWIFLDEPANASSTLTASPSSSTATISVNGTASNNIVGQQLAGTNTKASWENPSYTNFDRSYAPAPSPASAQPTPWPSSNLNKRSYTTAYYPTYPKLIKMIEKRKPANNIQPYCQQMHVNPDWSIVPNQNNNLVFIRELQYASTPISAGSRKRDTTNELESDCVCEWLST